MICGCLSVDHKSAPEGVVCCNAVSNVARGGPVELSIQGDGDVCLLRNAGKERDAGDAAQQWHALPGLGLRHDGLDQGSHDVLCAFEYCRTALHDRCAHLHNMWSTSCQA